MPNPYTPGNEITINSMKYSVVKSIMSTGANAGINGGMYLLEQSGKQYVLKVGPKGQIGSVHEQDLLKKAEMFHAYDENDRQSMLIMPYCPGSPLTKYFWDEENPIDIESRELEERYTIAFQVVSALLNLHEKRIIHDDSNPGNVLFDSAQKKVYIVDFGKSHYIGDKITASVAGQEAYRGSKIKINFERDISSFGNDIIKPLKIKSKVIDSMTRSDKLERPNLLMVLADLSMDAIVKKLSIWHKDQQKPTMATCLLWKNIGEAINDYRHHVMRIQARSIHSISITHGEESVILAQDLMHKISKLTSEKEIYEELSNFFLTYKGGTNAHSLKVLLAKAILGSNPASAPERESLVNQFMDKIKMHADTPTTDLEGLNLQPFG